MTNAPSNASSLTADQVLDCKGLLCPLPVYKTSQTIRKLSAGQVLRIECTDPGSMPDFRAFARQHGHTLLSAEDRDGVQTFYIRKEEAA
jgi:tRNA 2-thiouridine synthesizing protein A